LYINLEDPHERTDHAVVTQDHVLDVIVLPDRGWPIPQLPPELIASATYR
jgi:hypothetical protein